VEERGREGSSGLGEGIFEFEISGDEEESGVDVGFMVRTCAAEDRGGRRG